MMCPIRPWRKATRRWAGGTGEKVLGADGEATAPSERVRLSGPPDPTCGEKGTARSADKRPAAREKQARCALIGAQVFGSLKSWPSVSLTRGSENLCARGGDMMIVGLGD